MIAPNMYKNVFFCISTFFAFVFTSFFCMRSLSFEIDKQSVFLFANIEDGFLSQSNYKKKDSQVLRNKMKKNEESFKKNVLGEKTVLISDYRKDIRTIEKTEKEFEKNEAQKEKKKAITHENGEMRLRKLQTSFFDILEKSSNYSENEELLELEKEDEHDENKNENYKKNDNDDVNRNDDSNNDNLHKNNSSRNDILEETPLSPLIFAFLPLRRPAFAFYSNHSSVFADYSPTTKTIANTSRNDTNKENDAYMAIEDSLLAPFFNTDNHTDNLPFVPSNIQNFSSEIDNSYSFPPPHNDSFLPVFLWRENNENVLQSNNDSSDIQNYNNSQNNYTEANSTYTIILLANNGTTFDTNITAKQFIELTKGRILSLPLSSLSLCLINNNHNILNKNETTINTNNISNNNITNNINDDESKIVGVKSMFGLKGFDLDLYGMSGYNTGGMFPPYFGGMYGNNMLPYYNRNTAGYGYGYGYGSQTSVAGGGMPFYPYSPYGGGGFGI